MNYIEFLKRKIEKAPVSGFDVCPDEINSNLKPHQKDAVIWAIKGGRRALFESFGLGKTVQELEYCRLITKHKGGKICSEIMINDAIDLINRQKAEIDGQDVEIMRLKHEIEKLQAERHQYIQPFLQKAKSEAIKEFAERLKEKMKNCAMYCDDNYTYYMIGFPLIDNLVKEMAGEQNG